MPTGLIVPIHVAALCADKRQTVHHLQQAADFSKVPYWTEGYADVRNQGPYTSHRILSQTATSLSEGVHLHWSLPQGLCQGRFSDESEHVSFPPAPNRWMVTRIILKKSDKSEVSRKSWVQESDRLNKQNPVPGTWPPPPAVPVYAEDAADGSVGGLQSFRYLGQFTDADKWQEASDSTRRNECREYLGRTRNYTNAELASQTRRRVRATSEVGAPYDLSAVGYGDPTFASSYTDCGGVFGFHDRAADLAAAGYSATSHLLGYHVVGWFADPEKDPVAKEAFKLGPPKRPASADNDDLVAAYDAAYAEYLDSGLQVDDDSCCYAKEHKWLFAATESQQPGYSLYSGIIHDVGWNPAQEYEPPKDLNKGNEVAIGNTQPEALAAWLAAQLSRSGIASDEDMLNALQMGALPVLDEPSGIIKLRRIMHQSFFGSAPAGIQVLLQPKEASEEGRSHVRTEARPPVPPAFAKKLDDLNRAQWQHDELAEELRSLRQQIAADWQKYQYIARTVKDDMPNGSIPKSWLDEANNNAPGKVRDLINAEIKVHDHRKEQLRVLETAVAGKRSDVERAFVSSGLSEHYALNEQPAPQYYHATEPVVILSGPALQSSVHFGEESRLREDEFLACRLSPTSSGSRASLTASALAHPLGAALSGSMDALLEEAVLLMAGKKSPEEIPAHSIAVSHSVNEWIPLRLKWTVEYSPFHPIDQDGDGSTSYPPGLILDNYHLNFGEADLIPAGNALAADGVERAVVPSVNPALRGAHEATTTGVDGESRSPNARYQATIPVSPDAVINLQSQIDEYVDQLDDGPLKEKLKAFRDRLDDSPILGQSLEGVNPAFIMLKQSFQLPIDDPLWETELEEAFATKVRSIVERSGELGEESSYSFNPIRAGHLLISNLTVVDCFGRQLEIPVDNMIVARSLKPAIAGDNWVGLPPRIVTPSRLLFRWISAQDQQRSAVSDLEDPMCGWIMFNRLDSSLMIYSADGTFLGSLILIEREDKMVLWQGAPGSPNWGKPVEEVFRDENHYLRSFVVKFAKGSFDLLEAFMSALDRTLTLSLHKAPSDANASILLSKPLALVRASMKLDLLDLPPCSQRWEELKRVALAASGLNASAPVDEVVATIQRTTAAFEDVQMPVRLGELADVDDGLVGYFKGDDFGAFYAAGARPGDHEEVAPPTDATLALNCKPATPEANLTLLIDPYGKIHATSGALPVQALKLSPDLYVGALEQIEATFLMSPVIGSHVPVMEPAGQGRESIVEWAMVIPTPDESLQHGVWSWLEQPEPGTWSTLGVTPQQTQAVVSYSPQAVYEGWLRLRHQKPPAPGN